jgi:hypothetical protein
VAVSDWRDSGTAGGERPPWAPEAPGPATSGSWFANGRIWPVAVGLSLLVVVCVNLAFVYIAVTGADQVVPSYVEEER